MNSSTKHTNKNNRDNLHVDIPTYIIIVSDLMRDAGASTCRLSFLLLCFVVLHSVINVYLCDFL